MKLDYKLIKVLSSIVESMSASDLERISSDIISKFFPEIPMPKFKIVNTVTKWLGSCDAYIRHNRITGLVTNIDPTVIKIQKSVLDDEKTLHRILAHELIHAWDYTKLYVVGEPYPRAVDGHGSAFLEMAQKMNSFFGKDYVTKKTDESYIERESKDYYLVIFPYNDKDFGVVKFLRKNPTQDQKEQISKKIKQQKGHIVKTNDSSFRTVETIKKFGKVTVPTDTTKQAKLNELYHNGNHLDADYIVNKLGEVIYL